MTAIETITQAIRNRDARNVLHLMFKENSPILKPGFRTENDLWDFKSDCPRPGRDELYIWAHIAKDVLAFHNNKGGVLIFGIDDKDYSFGGAKQRLDSKLFNDQLHKFLSDRIWVDFYREFIFDNQRYLGMALIPPRGPRFEKFESDAPLMNNRRLFSKGESAIREGDSSRILKKEEVDAYVRKLASPTYGQPYVIDELYYRILTPEYAKFIERLNPCRQVEDAFRDPRAMVTSIIDIGGAGKTALATWAVLRAYERGDFTFIASITAKDRELTSKGIESLSPTLTSFESLLDAVLDVLDEQAVKFEPLDDKKLKVRRLIERSEGLLYVDNLETIDDVRIVEFLDDLPLGVRAVVTSRRPVVKVSVRPVELGRFSDKEMIDFINSFQDQSGLGYIADLKEDQKLRIGRYCDSIPLAIKWVLTRSQSAQESLKLVEGLTGKGHKGDRLLEFCFRRVFDSMISEERKALQVLSILQRPMPAEALMFGARLEARDFEYIVDSLVENSLVQRYFNRATNDYDYQLPPMVREFVYKQVLEQQGEEQSIRTRLKSWFEALDVSDSEQRLVTRDIRQGKESPDQALLDLAIKAESGGDYQGAEKLYTRALNRNPRSWQAAKSLGELYRHKLVNAIAAMRCYEQAAANAPEKGPDKARIYREWGMLLADSGAPESTDLAIEKFRVALIDAPDDRVTRCKLAQMLDRKGMYDDVIKLVGTLVDHSDPKTRDIARSLLAKAYNRSGEWLKSAELRLS